MTKIERKETKYVIRLAIIPYSENLINIFPTSGTGQVHNEHLLFSKISNFVSTSLTIILVLINVKVKRIQMMSLTKLQQRILFALLF